MQLRSCLFYRLNAAQVLFFLQAKGAKFKEGRKGIKLHARISGSSETCIVLNSSL